MKTIEFVGTDFLGKNVDFNFEEIGTIYPSDDTVYIHGNPVQISSVEVNNPDIKIRTTCGILDEVCVDCEENCIAAGKIHAQ